MNSTRHTEQKEGLAAKKGIGKWPARIEGLWVLPGFFCLSRPISRQTGEIDKQTYMSIASRVLSVERPCLVVSRFCGGNQTKRE